MSEQGMNDIDTGAIMYATLTSNPSTQMIERDKNDFKTTFYQFTIDNKFNDKFFGPCAHNINVSPGDRLCLIPYSCIWPDEITLYNDHNNGLTKDWSNEQLMERLSSGNQKYVVILDSNIHTSLLDLMCTYRFYSRRILINEIDKKISVHDFYLKGRFRFDGMVVKINNYWFLNFESTNKKI